MTLIQRCALTVQLQPSIAHIPGGALSTLPTRNTKQHRDTDHTIARSRFGPLGRTLLPPPIVIGDPPPSIFHRRTKGRLVPPGSIAFDSSTRRSFLTSFTAHRYARAPLSSGSRSSSIDPSSSSLSHLSRNSNIQRISRFEQRPRILRSDYSSKSSSRIFPQRKPGTGLVFSNGMLGWTRETGARKMRKRGTENWSSRCVHREIYSVERRARTARLSEEVGQLEAG